MKRLLNNKGIIGIDDLLIYGGIALLCALIFSWANDWNHDSDNDHHSYSVAAISASACPAPAPSPTPPPGPNQPPSSVPEPSTIFFILIGLGVIAGCYLCMLLMNGRKLRHQAQFNEERTEADRLVNEGHNGQCACAMAFMGSGCTCGKDYRWEYERKRS